MKITTIPRMRDRRKKRVAAYCRVSTLLAEQEESLATQMSYYRSLITSHDDWEFAGVYSDEKSGTKAENREGFQRMIKDALAGKVDRILVKSISRFSRNIVDCHSYVNLLRGSGVFVRFEKENLDTADPSCSMMLSFLSAIAQDESRSISENVRWAYRERYKRGEYNLGNNRILGYDTVDGKLVPNQDAGAVRLIFQMYLEGKSVESIRRLLADYGVRTKRGMLISHSGILYILQNETYRGDKHLQKQPPKDFLTKKPNVWEDYQSYYLENDHEAIVDTATWDAVQRRLEEQRELEQAVGHRGGKPHALFGLVYCGLCGSPMTRRTCLGRGGQKYKLWICRERHKGRKGNGCTCRRIWESDIMSAVCAHMGWEEVDLKDLKDHVKRITVEDEGVWVEKLRSQEAEQRNVHTD